MKRKYWTDESWAVLVFTENGPMFVTESHNKHIEFEKDKKPKIFEEEYWAKDCAMRLCANMMLAFPVCTSGSIIKEQLKLKGE